jgi:hypothetical protein
MSNLLLPDGSYTILPRLYANGTQEWYPSTKNGYWGRRIRFPGSTKVYDWSDGQFKTCTPTLCPKAQRLSSNSNVLVNYAPFFAEGGESYSVRAAASDAKKEIMKEFFGMFLGLDVTYESLWMCCRLAFIPTCGCDTFEWPVSSVTTQL